MRVLVTWCLALAIISLLVLLFGQTQAKWHPAWTGSLILVILACGGFAALALWWDEE